MPARCAAPSTGKHTHRAPGEKWHTRHTNPSNTHPTHLQSLCCLPSSTVQQAESSRLPWKYLLAIATLVCTCCPSSDARCEVTWKQQRQQQAGAAAARQAAGRRRGRKSPPAGQRGLNTSRHTSHPLDSVGSTHADTHLTCWAAWAQHTQTHPTRKAVWGQI
jgi:hypothetical protein